MLCFIREFGLNQMKIKWKNHKDLWMKKKVLNKCIRNIYSGLSLYVREETPAITLIASCMVKKLTYY